MSDAPPEARRTRNVVGSIAEGITFVLFIGTLTSQEPIVMAIAATWTFTALALPIFWRGAFTFAIQRAPSQEELSQTGLPEPRTVSTLVMMSLALGIVGSLASWGANPWIVLGEAVVLGGVLFAATYAADPPIRTAKQTGFLAAQCVFWGVGARAAILGLVFA